MANIATFPVFPSTAIVATGNSAPIPVEAYGEVIFYINVTAASGTPSTIYQYQLSPDQGTTWYSVPLVLTAAITAVGSYILVVPQANIGVLARLLWTVTGGTPSQTTTITATCRSRFY